MILNKLKVTGALLSGHFELSSGLHSDQYIQCAKFCMHSDLNYMAAGRLVDKLDEAAGKFTEVDSVISPAIGALLIGYETARWLDVAFKFTEKSEGLMHLRRGFTIEPGERVLIVEDVTTTGMSAVKVASLVEIAGGKVQAVLSIVNRVAPKVEAFNSYRHHFLVEFKPKTYIPSRCPMCADGISLDHPGSTK